MCIRDSIITCTRIAREKFDVDPGRENMFDVIRQFYVLVDSHFKEKKQVQDLSLIHILDFPMKKQLLWCMAALSFSAASAQTYETRFARCV